MQTIIVAYIIFVFPIVSIQLMEARTIQGQLPDVPKIGLPERSLKEDAVNLNDYEMEGLKIQMPQGGGHGREKRHVLSIEEDLAKAKATQHSLEGSQTHPNSASHYVIKKKMYLGFQDIPIEYIASKPVFVV